MLELRSNCKCCDRDLPPGAAAVICSFECTFCADCGAHVLKGTCPNCGGNLAVRPIRPASAQARHPAPTRRDLMPGGCTA